MATITGDKLEFRLKIAGWPNSFVTSKDMETTSGDGRVRVAALDRSNISFEHQVQMPYAELDSKGWTVKLWDDRDNTISTSLMREPDYVTIATATRSNEGYNSITAAATAIDVYDRSEITVGDVIHIGTEAIKVGATTATGGTSGSAHRITSLTRGYWDTIAQQHFIQGNASEVVDSSAAIPLTKRPLTLEGRRCWLYMYTEDDSRTGSGELIWRGVVTSDSKYNGDGSWSFRVDGRATLLKQRFGGELEQPSFPRGIYYPASAPLYVTVGEHESSSGTIDHPGVERVARFRLTGFWETQADFCADLEDYIQQYYNELDTTTGGGPSGLVWRVTPSRGQKRWRVAVITPTSGDLFYPAIEIFSLVDQLHMCGFSGEEVENPEDVKNTVAYNTAYHIRRFNGGRPHTTPDFECAEVGGGTVPRGTIYNRQEVVAPFHLTGSTWSRTTLIDGDNHVEGVLYLDRTAGIPAFLGTDITAEFDFDGDTRYLDLNASDATGSSITFDLGGETLEPQWLGMNASRSALRSPLGGSPSFTAPTAPVIKWIKRYATGTLKTLVDNITTNSADQKNIGALPDLDTDDINSPTIATRMASRHKWLRKRHYGSSKTSGLSKMLVHEARLYGCYWSVASQGKLRLRQLRQPTARSVFEDTLTDDDILIDEGYPEWERGSQFGYITQIELQTGWSERENKADGVEFKFRDNVLMTQRAGKELGIKPRSRSRWRITTEDYEDLANHFSPIFGMFGAGFAVVSLDVGFDKRSLEVGDYVKLTSSYVPNVSTGLFGVTNKPAVILGKRFDPPRGRIALKLYVSVEDAGGYPPSLRITGSGGSGTSWNFDVATTTDGTNGYDLLPSGSALSDFYTVNDRVEVYTFDSTSTSDVGYISAVGTSDVDVEFDASFSGLGADTWYIGFEQNGAATESAQESYVYVADATDNKLSLNSGDVKPWKFSS